jgi:hypothetical protein
MKNRIRNRVVLSLTSIGLFILVLVILGPAPKGAKALPNVPMPPFTQCPPIGMSASCGVLVEFTDTGTNIFVDPSVPPYDGVEDTLVGVQNDSSTTQSSVTLAGVGVNGIPIFEFDGDGLCAGFTGAPPGCPFGPTGYEGPGTSFSNISPDTTTGTVNFAPSLAPGASAYFSLEDQLTGASFTTPTPIPTASPTATFTPTPTPTVPPQEAYVTISQNSVRKGHNAAFIVALDPGPAGVPVTVNYTMGGSAVLGTDYTLSGPPGQVTIPAGQTFATVILHAQRNVKKNAIMTLRPGSDYFLSGLADDVATIRIQKK